MMRKMSLGRPLVLLLFLGACENDRLDRRERYFTGVEILAVPALQYDSDNSPPDLRVDLKRSSVNFWEFSSFSRRDAQRLPVFLNFFSDILATDEFYTLRLVDEDPNELDDDEIFFWEFQAIEDGRGGEIEFFDRGQLVLVLTYENR